MNGLSTLNRLWGKKNKDVSRSTSNISKSITNLDTTSQQNKIVPIVNNAPFEQTFRVTVYLPKNQLYVERIGAKTKLDKLLDQICENKHLNRNKFEFRHPGDMSMVFNGDSTIGEVGLNELKMVLKSESQFNSNFQDMLKYKSQTSNSVTSSEISRNSKSLLRKSSPYSSSNSINSLDSTGMSTSLKMAPPVAPARKKRLAPRPPSQIIIPEKGILSTNINDVLLKEPCSILPRRNFHVSSQQLHSTDGYQGNHQSKLSIHNAVNEIECETDKNNNNIKSPPTPEPVEFKRMSVVTRPMSNEHVESKQTIYLNRSRTSSESSEVNEALKSYTDATPIKRIPAVNQNEVKSHKKSAPAPPPRSVPVPSPRTVQEMSPIKIDELDDPINEITNTTNNVSKVMLNVNINQQIKPHETTTVDTNSHVSIQIINNKPITEFVPTEVVKLETKRMVEDVRVVAETKMSENRYNEEEKNEPVVNKKSVELIPIERNVKKIKVVKEVEDVSVNQSKVHVSLKEVELSRPTSPLWTYTLPAPPIFADNNASLDNQQPTQLCTETNTFYNDFTSTVGVERLCSETTTVISDTTIQPIICERKKLLDDSFITIVQENNKLNEDTESEKSAEIITSDIEDGYQGGKKPLVMMLENKFNFHNDKTAHEIKADDFENHPVVLRHQISRSDSFHAIGQQNFRTSALSFSPQKSDLKSKSISYISLVQAQKNEALLSKSNSNNMLYSKRKSTSELSITDSPSLQSLEVMKSILNSSRKSSLQDAVIIEQPSPYEGKSLDDNVFVQSVTTEIKMAEKYSPIEETIAEKYSPNEEMIEEKDKLPENSNKWKYQGPPKINLSTWSERPKIEVSIKSDNDYKFGGSSTLPRGLKTTSNNITAITINHTIDDTDAIETKNSVTVSTDENATDEVDNRLPKVLGFEYKKKNSFVQLRETSKMPDNSTDSKISIKARPVSMDVTTKSWTASPASQIISFNRLSTSHNKFVPVVYGFKLNNISEVAVNNPEPLPKEPKLLPVVVENKIVAENKTVVEVMRNKVNEKEPAPTVPVKPSFLRSTSVDDMSKKFRFTTYDNRNSLTTIEPNPFSQQTLRRTGLKQKILLQDTETESMFGRVIEVQPTTIKLSNQHAPPQTDRKVSVDVVKLSTSRQLSSPNPPPPPPMAPSFKTIKKPHVIEVDTRNQLLDSIKRFNRDLLKRE
ncbi:unnamed protein product [Diamesa serratosioi]